MKWTEADKKKLSDLYLTHSRQEIADIFGVSNATIRAVMYRYGMNTKQGPRWSAKEIRMLTDLYEQANYIEDVNIPEFAKKIGRTVDAIHLKASKLKLKKLNKLKKKNPKKRINQFLNDDDRRKHTSDRMKKLWETREHPRGMLGKKHTDEVRQKMIKTAKAYNASLTQKQKVENAIKGMKTKIENGTAYRERKASWKSGWREIGDTKKYYRSMWEANYARYLQWLKERGEISDWKHEPKTFWFEKIKRGSVTYLPDFLVIENNGSEAYHEVKGWMDDRSKTKLKRMAKYYPDVKIIVIGAKEYNALKKQMSGIIPGWETNERGR